MESVALNNFAVTDIHRQQQSEAVYPIRVFKG